MAENPLPNCGFCDTPAAASWRCDGCGLFLCDSCNHTLHTKIKHHVEELKEILNTKINSLSDLKSKIANELPIYLEKAKEFANMESEGFVKYNEIKEKIYSRKTYLKEKIEEEAKNGLDVLNSLWKTQNNPIAQEKERLQNNVTELTTRKRKIEDVLETKVPEKIFQAIEQLNKDVHVQQGLDIKVPKFMFIETEPTEHGFNSFFGLLMKKPSLKIIVRYDIDLPDIAGIVTLNDKMSVVYSARKRTFKHLIITETEIITSVNINMHTEIQKLQKRYRREKTMDMTAYKENILFTIADNDDQVMLYNITSVNEFTDFDSLQATCVHCNGSEIFVGYKVSSPDACGIMVLNCENRKVQRKIEFSEQKILTFPAKVVTNIKHDMCVIDQYRRFRRQNTYEDHKRVVVLGKWGQPKWNYEGNPTINSKVGFSPVDIVTTGSGLVLIAEKVTSSIHVLSENGQFITQLGRDQGIFRPVSLNMNTHGQLLIVCSSNDSEKNALQFTAFQDPSLQLCLTELSVT